LRYAQTMPAKQSQGWLFSFILLGIIWGSSFLFIEEMLKALPPVGVAFWRTALGAITVWIFVFARNISLPKNLKQVVLIWISGLFMSAIPAVLFSIAQQHVSSSLASIMNAATPIFTVIMILIAFRQEKPKPYVLIGLFVGLVGVGTVLAVWQGFGSNDPVGVIMLLAAVTCYGIGTPFIRNFVEPMKLPTESAVATQIGTSALSLLPIYALGPLFGTPIFTVSSSTAFTWQFIGSSLALGVLGTGLAYILFYDIIARAGSAIAASVTYITPLIGVLLGVLVLGETVSWHEPVGGAIVLLGAAIAQNRIKLSARFSGEKH